MGRDVFCWVRHPDRRCSRPTLETGRSAAHRHKLDSDWRRDPDWLRDHDLGRQERVQRKYPDRPEVGGKWLAPSARSAITVAPHGRCQASRGTSILEAKAEISPANPRGDATPEEEARLAQALSFVESEKIMTVENPTMAFGWRVYGLGGIALGMAGLAWGDFLLGQPVAKDFPYRTPPAY